MGIVHAFFRSQFGTPVGKGPPRDSAWIMLLLAPRSSSLSKALQFGSTLAGGRLLGLREKAGEG